MILFNSDYIEGAHEKIMERLLATNREQTEGYGTDRYCQKAKERIRNLCENDVDVHFLVGGTQTNMTVIAASLRPHQGVIAAQTAHINVHETGAIESCGHKVLVLPSSDGKIMAEQVRECYEEHIHNDSFEHIVQPKMVYISNPTELGTIYSRDELESLSQVCRETGLLLYLDGARLGYGLTAKGNNLTISDIARLCDVFYIGGTKIGALFGEAVVIKNQAIREDFRYLIKQKGGMLAKGRLLGIQFMTLFEDDLYMQMSYHADRLADRIRDAFTEAGISFLTENTTNQIFPVLTDIEIDILQEKYGFNYEKRIDDTYSAVRFCTSWATKEEDVESLIADIRQLNRKVN